MDTKLKKSKSFLIWLCFFFGLNIIVSFAILGLAVTQSSYFGFEDIKASFNSDYKHSGLFKKNVSDIFDQLAQSVAYEKVTPASTNAASSSDYLDQEGENLIYYAINLNTGKTITNIGNKFSVSDTGPSKLPEGNDYYLFYNSSRFTGQQDGLPLDIYRNDSGYSRYNIVKYMSKNIPEELKEIENCRILLVVKKDIVKNPYSYSALYNGMQTLKAGKWFVLIYSAIFLFGFVIFIISIVKRKTKQEFDKKLAAFTGWFWFEFKFVASLLVFALLFSIPGFSYSSSIPASVVVPLFIIAICFWWFYLILVDLIVNKRKVFSHNSINSVIKRYRAYESKKPFQKGMMVRVYTLIASETVLILFAMIFATISLRGDAASFFILLLIIGVGIYLIYRYMRRYGNMVNDIGFIMNQVEKIRKGEMKEVHNIRPDADLYPVQENLNTIQEGLSKAIEEKIRSERMKAELVTNVSHDLKTPLTSIISYVDLLSREEDLPPHVKDYIMILVQKSERLKTLIQDLFDLSKVNSGNVAIEKEKLDLGRVIKQTLADMNEEISQSGLAFKVKFPDEPIFVMSDGSKLYRVLQNLLTNTLKYSLSGSRVYIDAGVTQGKAIITIRNTANYEMNFNEDEITERFVRGDEARTTEGTGLGLAIAQSFTHACGGTLKIKVDGDLFKVILTFDICN